MPAAQFILALCLMTGLVAFADEISPRPQNRPALFLNELNVASASIPSGSPLTLSVTLTSQSSAKDTSFFLRLYLSSDPIITADDTYIGTQALPPFTSGESLSIGISMNIPSDTPPDTYYLGARIEKSDDTAIHALTGPLIKIVRDVDLTIGAIATHAGALPMGSKVTVSSSIQNIGTTPTTSAPIKVSFYLSEDATITRKDTLVGSHEINALIPPGETSTIETEVKIPIFAASDLATSLIPNKAVPAAPGSGHGGRSSRLFYLGAIIDPDNIQPENNETNNTYLGPKLEAVRDVDLAIAGLETSARTLPIGAPIHLQYMVKNTGATPMVAPSVIGIYLSTDDTIASSDLLLATGPILSLEAGATVKGEMSVGIPANLPPHSYHLGAIADAYNTQPENDEGNNAYPGPRLEAVRDVDLVVTQLETGAAMLAVGTPVTLRYGIKNAGTTPMTSPAVIGIYLSADNTITAADILLGSSSVFSLDAGASAKAEISIGIPANLPPQSYYLGAIADAYNAQPETNEDNNAYLGSRVSAVRDVDLAVTRIETSEKAVSTGARIKLKFTIKNQGSTPMTAPTAIVGIYLSADNIITASDSLLGMGSVNPLPAGASESVEISLPVPANLAPGNYYLGVIANISDQQPEKEKANNVMAGPRLNITPPG